jgi:exportin-1
VLTTLKEHPDAWTRVDTILEFSNNQQTKYYALQILEQVIKTRWKVLPRNQCEGKDCFSFMVRLVEVHSEILHSRKLLWSSQLFNNRNFADKRKTVDR